MYIKVDCTSIVRSITLGIFFREVLLKVKQNKTSSVNAIDNGEMQGRFISINPHQFCLSAFTVFVQRIIFRGFHGEGEENREIVCPEVSEEKISCS